MTDVVLYKAYRGSRESGVMLIVEPMDDKRLIVKLLELRNRKRETMLIAFLETEKLRAMYKTLLSGSFDDFYPKGYIEWGSSSRTHCITKDGPLVSIGEELRMFVFQRHSEREGDFAVRIACYEKLEGEKPALLKSLGVPLSGRETIEMLDRITTTTTPENKGRTPTQMKQLVELAQSTLSLSEAHTEGEELRSRLLNRQSRRGRKNKVVAEASSRVGKRAIVSKRKEEPKRSFFVKQRGPIGPIQPDEGENEDEVVMIEEAVVRPDEVRKKPVKGDIYDDLEKEARKMPAEEWEDDLIAHPLQIVHMFIRQPYMLHKRRDEELHLVWLDSRYRVIETQRYPNVSRIQKAAGGYRQVLAFRPLDVLLMVPKCGAAALVMVHNHPGEYIPSASQSDIFATLKLKKHCEKAGIDLFDHVIIGENGWYSYHLKQRHEGFKWNR